MLDSSTWLGPLARFFFINIIAMIYHCADFIVSHKHIHPYIYTYTYYTYALLSALAFDIISLCVRRFFMVGFLIFP